jgi:hypothetical protein
MVPASKRAAAGAPLASETTFFSMGSASCADGDAGRAPVRQPGRAAPGHRRGLRRRRRDPASVEILAVNSTPRP